jgi:hypothetical protein
VTNLKGLWSGKKETAKSGEYKLKGGFWGGKFKGGLKKKTITTKSFKGLKGGLFGSKKKLPVGPQRKWGTNSKISPKTGPPDLSAPTEKEMAKWLNTEHKSISDSQESANKKITKLHNQETKKFELEDKKNANLEEATRADQDKAINAANKIFDINDKKAFKGGKRNFEYYYLKGGDKMVMDKKDVGL